MRIRLTKVMAFAAVITLLGAVGSFAEEKTMTPLDIPMIGDVQPLANGTAAPAFEVKDVSGKPFAFKGGESKEVRLMVFWSIFCEPCREEMPLVQALYERHKGEGFDVISVALDGNLDENIRQFVKQGKYTFKVLLDQESSDGSLVVAEKYTVPGTPTLYVIDRSGKISYSKVGRTSEKELDTAIVSALGR